MVLNVYISPYVFIYFKKYLFICLFIYLFAKKLFWPIQEKWLKWSTSRACVDLDTDFVIPPLCVAF